MVLSGSTLLKDVHIGIPHGGGGGWQLMFLMLSFCLVPMGDFL